MSIYQSSLNYYVYAYLREDGSPYYIGKGCRGRAWHKHSGCSAKPPKDTSRIIIMESNLTDIGALALERRLIRWYGRKDNQTGILHNLTDGGDGSNPGPEARKKMSEASKGKKRPEHSKVMKERHALYGHPLVGKMPWNKGKKGVYSEEALEKMRKPKSEEHKLKMRGERTHLRGKIDTPETRERKSKAMKKVWAERKKDGFV